MKRSIIVGIHWGTFDGMSDEPLDQPPKDLAIAKAASSVRLHFTVLQHGQNWRKPLRAFASEGRV